MSAAEVLVPAAEKPALATMLQSYVHEMVELTGASVPPGGYPFLDAYWTEPDGRWPYWLRRGEANAGFALVRRDLELGWTEMAEFFVAPQFRRHGIGLESARRLIARYPGGWRITQREVNAGAIAFWHRVLNGFVAYDEVTTKTNAVRREQRFTFG